MSACSFSTLRQNLVLTHGIAPDVHGGIHIFIFPTPTTIQSMFKYKILVLLKQNISTAVELVLYCLVEPFFPPDL